MPNIAIEVDNKLMMRVENEAIRTHSGNISAVVIAALEYYLAIQVGLQELQKQLALLKKPDLDWEALKMIGASDDEVLTAQAIATDESMTVDQLNSLIASTTRIAAILPLLKKK